MMEEKKIKSILKGLVSLLILVLLVLNLVVLSANWLILRQVFTPDTMTISLDESQWIRKTPSMFT